MGLKTDSRPAVGGLTPVDAWNELLCVLRDPDIERIVTANHARIQGDAALAGVSERCFETQFRLHLPSKERSFLADGHPATIYDSLRPRVMHRSSVISESRSIAAAQTHASLLLGGEVLRRDGSLTRLDGVELSLALRRVPPSVGDFIQARLHYLRSARSDTTHQYGVFLKAAAYPLVYMGFSICDRRYIIDALQASGVDADRENTLMLTRVHGLASNPHNLVSLGVSRAVRELKALGRYRFVVTAFNPTLGFTGAAFHAANFTPFAIAPVTYHYDGHGLYQTRRQSGQCLTQKLDVRGNVLAALGIDRHAQHELRAVGKIHNISPDNYRHNDRLPMSIDTEKTQSEWVLALPEYRSLLESAWSPRTIHPSYSFLYDRTPSPRGQCGVSSVWLARELRSRFGVEAEYCYGRLSFEETEIVGVDHHCWLELGPKESPDRMVVDLTCDQAIGFDRSILCRPYSELSRKGIIYVATSRLRLDELPGDRVWPRFLALREAIEAIQYAEESASLPGASLVDTQ